MPVKEMVTVFGVDLQNDFGYPGGSLFIPDGFWVVGGGMILNRHAANNGWNIMFSRDNHPINSKHFEKWPPHCVAGTWGARFLPGLKYAGGHIFSKGMDPEEDGYDPFDGKDTHGYGPGEILGEPRLMTLVVWGLATNFCVLAFVLTARSRGHKVYVALDACRAVPTPKDPPPGFITEGQAIEKMKEAGAIMTTVEEVVCGKLI